MKTNTLPGGFLVPANDQMGDWCVQAGRLDHDRFLIPFCASKIPYGGVVVDAGAYFGDHTIAYSEAAGPDGRVIAIEAGADNYNLLWHNVQRFPFQNVFTTRVALGRKAGDGHYYVNENNRGASFVVATDDPDSEMCSVVALDDILEKIDRRVDFIKLDIEGSEYEALQGMRKTLAKDRPAMVMEINQAALARNGADFDKITAFLKAYEYNWQVLTPEGVPVQFEIYCTPQRRPI